MKMRNLLATFLLTFVSTAAATGPYISKIKTLQVVNIGNSNTTVFLNLDITDSICSGTNRFDRFKILNDAQMSVILAAVMADKEITIYGTGGCGSGTNEEISSIRINP